MAVCVSLMLWPSRGPGGGYVNAPLRSEHGALGDEDALEMVNLSPSPHPTEEQVNMSQRGIEFGSGTVLPWSTIQSIHWDILFLLGGGLALSLGFQVPRHPLLDI